jgi:hypothetical protein
MLVEGDFEAVTNICLKSIGLQLGMKVNSDLMVLLLAASLMAQNRLTNLPLWIKIYHESNPVYLEIGPVITSPSDMSVNLMSQPNALLTQLHLQIEIQNGDELSQLMMGICCQSALERLNLKIGLNFKKRVTQEMKTMNEQLQLQCNEAYPIRWMQLASGVLMDMNLPARQRIFDIALQNSLASVEQAALVEYQSYWPVALYNLSPSLSHLALVGSKMGENGALALASWVKASTALCSLDLSGNFFCKGASGAIFKALNENRQISLRALDMSDNWVCGANYFKEWIERATALKHLSMARDLAYYQPSLVRNEQIGHLFGEVKTKVPLTHLDLSGNHNWRISEMTMFVKWIGSLPLQRLSLRGNSGFGADTLLNLIVPLQTHTHLKQLDLSDVNIRPETKEMIKGLLPRVTVQLGAI